MDASLTDTDIIARYTLYCGDLRDATWWYYHANVSEFENTTASKFAQMKPDNNIRVCQYIDLLCQGRLKK